MKIVKEKIVPVCPYCEKKLQHMIEVDRGFWTLNRVFCCPHCSKVLGVSAGMQ